MFCYQSSLISDSGDWTCLNHRSMWYTANTTMMMLS